MIVFSFFVTVKPLCMDESYVSKKRTKLTIRSEPFRIYKMSAGWGGLAYCYCSDHIIAKKKGRNTANSSVTFFYVSVVLSGVLVWHCHLPTNDSFKF